MNYPIKRTPEEGHTAACQAKAMITAIENWRDMVVDDAARIGMPSLGDGGFRTWAQDNQAMHDADNLLIEGLTECICPEEDK
jgi:hypothetical protein